MALMMRSNLAARWVRVGVCEDFGDAGRFIQNENVRYRVKQKEAGTSQTGNSFNSDTKMII